MILNESVGHSLSQTFDLIKVFLESEKHVDFLHLLH